MKPLGWKAAGLSSVGYRDSAKRRREIREVARILHARGYSPTAARRLVAAGYGPQDSYMLMHSDLKAKFGIPRLTLVRRSR
jgi:hypothetical protein